MSYSNDDELKAELKKYGETSVIKITDKNRDIYIKKLNHYKARQKWEVNPSKDAKQVNMSKYKTKTEDEDEDEDEEDDESVSYFISYSNLI